MAILNRSSAIDKATAYSGVCPKKLKAANNPASRVLIPKNEKGINVINEVIVMISSENIC